MVLGLSSKREITQTSIRVRTVMAVQTRAWLVPGQGGGWPGSLKRMIPASGIDGLARLNSWLHRAGCG